MTESKAIKFAKEQRQIFGGTMNEFLGVAIKALGEAKQYRKIGTVEECRDAVEKHKPKNPTERISAYALARNYGGDEAHKVYYDCPTCNAKGLEYNKPCYHCGQLLDWSNYKSVVWNRSGEE